MTSREEGHLVSRLSHEYLTLRIALVCTPRGLGEASITESPSLTKVQAWRQDRLDLAKLMLAKHDLAANNLEPSSAEELADTLFEIGKSQVKKSQWSGAIPWLEKAHDVLSGQNLEALSSDAGELQISIMHSTARALMHQGDEGSRSKSWNIIRQLVIECGDRLAVLILKLDIFVTDLTSSAVPRDYCDILQRIVRTVHLTDTNVKTIIHHIHKLRSRSPPMAHAVLVTLLTERLFGTEEQKWLEKTLVTIIWNCTTSTDPLDIFRSLDEILDALAAGSSKPLSPSAANAAQVLLWKRIETSYNREAYEAAEDWCQLSLHPVFGSSGALNIGKLQRKLILCALGRSDVTKAREIYAQMSTSNKRDPSTQYLLYKVALRYQDPELATECLDTICNISAKDATLLYACVLEAQQTGDQSQMVNSLQRILQKYNYNAPNEAHLPALLRCTARLLIREVETPSSQVGNAIDEICKLFEAAADQAKTSRQDATTDVFSLAELDWFSRNSYNLALKVCTSWDPGQTLRLVQSCFKFIDLYPATTDAGVVADLSLRRLFCAFLCGSLLIVLARNEDRVEEQLQHYLNLRKVVDDFRKHAKDQISRLEGGAKDDLRRKYSGLLAFDYEAAARLKAWGSLDPILKETQEHGDPEMYEILADITLSFEAPSEIMITTLQQIINITWQYDNNNIDKLARWIRCLFTLALTSDLETAGQVVNQVATIAETSRKQSMKYPAEELEWLTTTTFNRAIDFYCSSHDALCRRWAERALALSSLCDDGGQLHELLQRKYQGLTWHE